MLLLFRFTRERRHSPFVFFSLELKISMFYSNFAKKHTVTLLIISKFKASINHFASSLFFKYLYDRAIFFSLYTIYCLCAK